MATMRRFMLFALIAAAASPALAQPRPTRGYQDPPDIVVTAQRLQDYRDRLAACLARNCPVNEDADATLALAEALFLNGTYGEARRLVQASLDRNRRQASSFPEPVSDLYRAHTRLSRHLGYDEAGLRSAHGILNALQAGLPVEDHRHFTARLELSDIEMLSGRYRSARRELSDLAREALAVGRRDVATIAWLRMLWFDYMYDPHGGAKAELIRRSRLTDPAQRIEAVGARILLARIYRSERDDARANALIAEIGRGGSAARRRLIHEPSYQLNQMEVRLEGDQSIDDAIRYGNTLSRLTVNYEDKWIDVGFWVLPDGHVSGLEIIRRGSGVDWADPLLTSIRGRLYSTAPEASYRLERYTFTAIMQTATGTRIPRHSPRSRVEYLDLTVDGEAPPPPTPAAPTSGMTQ
jgi:hypothetical protein